MPFFYFYLNSAWTASAPASGDSVLLYDFASWYHTYTAVSNADLYKR